MAVKTKRKREREKRQGKHKRLRLFLLVLLGVLIYESSGALIPFYIQPTVSQAFQASFQPGAFYGTGSPDRAALIADNGDALDIRLRMINEAQERIIFSSFDVRDCQSGRDVFAALLSAAERGVDIKILADGMNGLVSMSPKPMFRALGQLSNVEIRYYNTPNPLMPWTFNGRLHDKYIIIDDRLLLLGGRNTFDKFLGEYVPEAERSHDLDVLIYNTAAGTGQAGQSVLAQTEAYFRSIWAGEHVKTHLDSPSAKAREETALLRARWTSLLAGRPWLSESAPLDYQSLTVPLEGATLIHNPTGILAKEPLVWWQLMQLLAGAEESAYLQTPYAVLSQDMYEGLRYVADKPNQFTIQLNSVAVGDNFMASSDYVHNRQAILQTGAVLQEYFGDFSSHGKSALIDSDLALVGSYNLDMRSTYIDTELMLVLHSEAFNHVLETHLNAMEARSLQVQPDGSYLPKPGVTVKEILPPRKYLFPITSVVFQLFRNLL